VSGDGIEVKAGTGLRHGQETMIPLVQVTVDCDGHTHQMVVTPSAARRIGLDFLSAAVMSWADTGVRMAARKQGFDGDSTVDEITALVKVALEAEDRGEGA